MVSSAESLIPLSSLCLLSRSVRRGRPMWLPKARAATPITEPYLANSKPTKFHTKSNGYRQLAEGAEVPFPPAEAPESSIARNVSGCQRLPAFFQVVHDFADDRQPGRVILQAHLEQLAATEVVQVMQLLGDGAAFFHIQGSIQAAENIHAAGNGLGLAVQLSGLQVAFDPVQLIQKTIHQHEH